MAETGAGSPVAVTLARYYDLDLADDTADIDMYLAFAEAADGQVLELMAGSGRVAVPLAGAGHNVTAVDRDAQMLARAAARWQHVADRGGDREAGGGGALELVEADVTQLALDKRFDLVIVAFNSLLLLDGRDAQRRLFEVIARHLTPDGRAVVDVWLPDPADLAIYDGRLVLDWVRTDEETGESVSKTTAARYESASRIAHVTSFFDAWRDGATPTRVAREDAISFASADELQRLADDAGLSVETLGGDYEMGHFDGASERVVMVCRSGVG